jgi:hypothetical protein
MPFNTLLLTCLIPGTRFSESGCVVRLKPEPQETVLFFHVDDQSNPDCVLCEDLGLEGKVCDLVIFYALEDRKVLCLLEMKKGQDFEKAAKQIMNTYQYLRRFFRESLGRRPCGSHLRSVDWKAYIHLHGGSPKNRKQLERTPEWKTLSDDFGRDGFTITSNPNLGWFLRG